MKSNLFAKDNLKIARIGYYSKERNGIVLEKSDAYAILYLDKDDNQRGYYNVFDEKHALPVFRRSRVYTNYTKDGEPYGTMIIQVGGRDVTGPCYIIDDSDALCFLPQLVTKNRLKEIIYRSKYFFPDRLSLLNADKPRQRIKHFFKMVGDDDRYLKLIDYFNRNDELGIQYVKK